MTNTKVLSITITLITLLTACTPPYANGTTPLAPATTSQPSPAADVPLYQQVALASTTLDESSQTPPYIISGQSPLLTGSDDPRVISFNALAASIMQTQVDEFKNNVASAPSLPADGASSSLVIKYILLAPSLEIISIKFDISVYIQGAAHPFNVARVLNFDIESGQELSLNSLFLPDSGYLLTIANFCAAELQKRDIGFDTAFSQGAAPLPENYRNWNLTADGLLITFEQYQVGAAAAGSQTVSIPFAELTALVNPQGALAKFLQ